MEVSLLGSLQGEIGVPTPWGQGFCIWSFASHRKLGENGGTRKTKEEEKDAAPSKERGLGVQGAPQVRVCFL